MSGLTRPHDDDVRCARAGALPGRGLRPAQPLETLSLRAGHIYNYDLGFLLANTSLWSLDVGHTLLNDNAIPRLRQFKLESLDIAGARFTDDGVRALRERFPLATIVT
jgi:hypothetical protein